MDNVLTERQALIAALQGTGFRSNTWRDTDEPVKVSKITDRLVQEMIRTERARTIWMHDAPTPTTQMICRFHRHDPWIWLETVVRPVTDIKDALMSFVRTLGEPKMIVPVGTAGEAGHAGWIDIVVVWDA